MYGEAVCFSAHQGIRERMDGRRRALDGGGSQAQHGRLNALTAKARR